MVSGRRIDLFSAIALPLGIAMAVQGSTPAPRPAAPASVDTAAVSYAKDIAPIFKKRCVRCHGGMDDGEPRKEASFDITTYKGIMAGSEYGPEITPGDVENSYLIEEIVTGDMPDEGDPVPPEEIALIKAWVAQGAKNN